MSDADRIQRLKGALATGGLRLASLLPWRLNRLLGGLLGHLAASLPGRHRHITKTNIRLCFPTLPASAQRRLVRQSLVEDARAAVEIGYVWHHPDAILARVQSVEGDGPLREALASGQPLVLLVPHLGCWEVVNYWIGNHFSVHAMFAPSELPQLDDLVLRSREHFNSTMYPATARGVARLVRTLRQGSAMTGILPDQVADEGSGRFVPFFGVPAYTGTLSVKLIAQTGARVFVCTALRQPHGYRLIFRDPDPAIHDPDLDTALTALNRSVEDMVREAPAQYLWSYKRFRRATTGHKNPY
ncbi:lysophospholipid acyltransferase family protein [Isoalcanivorax indicus]|uniref:lysophospholipid acyltransferase family protein n=1 Tax=Isoalcanivorax indicus TaxID=2202653 RepID=UPI000DB94993|nr:lysophospholipid acyltransferase family protein [Isoalcanivorax indicus]